MNISKSNVLPIILAALFLSSFVLIFDVYGVGTTLSSQLNLTNSNEDSTVPQIAANGSKVYIVYVESDPGAADTDIVIINSTNSGSSFQPKVNVTNTLTTNSEEPQIAFSGEHVYLTWTEIDADGDGGDDIYFAQADINDANTGFTLSNLSNGAGNTADSADPQIAANGTNVYVVWSDLEDDADDGEIYFRASKDNGDTWTPTLDQDPTNLSNTSTNQDSDFPQIAAAGNSVYVVWQDEATTVPQVLNKRVHFRGSIDQGDNFSTTSILHADTYALTPQITVSDQKIHTVWDSGLTSGHGVQYRQITNGSTFSFLPVVASAPVALTDGTSNTVSVPQIASSGSNVYVVWQESVSGTQEVYFSNSTDSGASFSESEELSASGDSDTEIPQIANNGTNVYVVWRDETSGSSTDTDILIKTSVKTEFASFGSSRNLANNTSTAGNQIATTPSISAGTDKIFTVWDDNGEDPDSGTDSEILFVVGTTTDVDVEFTNTSDTATAQFRLSETARVKITAPNSNDNSGSPESIVATITSSTDSTGISVTLTETGNDTGIFTGDITFSTISTDDDSDRLLASAGDTITAGFSSQSGTASIYSRTIALSSDTEYALSATPFVTVTDQNSNKDSNAVEHVIVTLTSTNAERGEYNPITLTLAETGANTGQFGGDADVDFIFMNDHDAFPLDRNITITQDDTTENDSATDIDETTVTITTTTTPGGVAITLRETGINTAIFEGPVVFSSIASTGNVIQSNPGDFVSVTDGSLVARSLIVPNLDKSNGALRVKVTADSDGNNEVTDTVTASYLGATDSAPIGFTGAEKGGGGGGAARPTLVLDAVAGLAIFTGGGGGDKSAPSTSLRDAAFAKAVNIPKHIQTVIDNHDPHKPIEGIVDETFDFPFSIDEKGFALSSYYNTVKTNKIKTGEPINLKTTFFENSKLEHVSLHFNLRNVNPEIQNSDTKIVYNVGEPIEIIDPHGYIESVTPILVEDGIKTKVDFEIVFAKEMETSDLIIRTWDENRNSADTVVADAFEISDAPEIQVESAVKEVKLDEIPAPTDTPKKEEVKVPEWVKMNAKWWTEDNITDTEFTKGIEFLIVDNIIALPEPEVDPEPGEEVDPEPGEEVEEEKEKVRPPTVQKMPDWIKTNAKWWSDGQLTDTDFINAIKFLVEKQIIEVN